ncbi:MAG: FtsW/RodA/SpoVE family cell cycle protein [Anaerovoracaceae bacterium]
MKLPFITTEGQEPADFVVKALVTALVIFGVVMVFSASYYNSISATGSPFGYLKKQLFFATIGALVMVFMSYFDYHKLAKANLPLMIITVAMLVMVLAGFGTTVNGATRWIRIGPISIMPGEFAKVSAILFTSVYFRGSKTLVRSFTKGIVPVALYTLLLAALIVKQPNLSTALTLCGIVFVIMWIAGLHFMYGVVAIGGVIGGLAVIAKVGGTFWANRILSFTHPFDNAKGDGFQVVQGFLALGSGGLFGKGIGKSVQKTLYLPEPQNDFILAIIGEELGFVGVVILLCVFAWLVWRTLIIALKAPDRFGMLLTGGVAAMLGLQVLLNVAVVTSSMPPTGIALPFISYGGNSLWIFMGSFGVVLNVSRQEAAAEKKRAAEEAQESELRESREFYDRYHGRIGNEGFGGGDI